MDENNQQQKNSIGQGSTPVIHTYAGDMAEMVRDHEGSVIKIAMAEQRRRELDAEKERNEKKKKLETILVIGGIVLVVGTIYGMFFLKQKTAEDSVHKETLTQNPTLLPADDESVIDATKFAGKEDLQMAFKKEREVPIKSGSVRAVTFTTGLEASRKILKTGDFLNLLKSGMPGSMKRTLNDSMMIGTYFTGSTNSLGHTFIIFKTSDYDHAYAGSLAWENTMLDEFFPIFDIDISGENAKLLEKRFEDLLIENKDTRIITDANGTPLIYSLFLDRNYYMMTDSEGAIIEMSKRLRTINARPL